MNKNKIITSILITSFTLLANAYALEVTENSETIDLTTLNNNQADISKVAPTPKKEEIAKSENKENNDSTNVVENKNTTNTPTQQTVESVAPKTEQANITPNTSKHIIGKTIYITDNAYVWLRRGAGAEYRLTGSVKAGEPVTLLDSNNKYYKVQLSNGKIAWVPQNETQTQVSFREQVTSLQAENEALKFKLENIDSETAKELTQVKQELAALKIKHSALEKQQAEESERLKEITVENEDLNSKLETKELDMKLRWWKQGALIAGIGALIGIILVYLPRPRRRQDYY